MFYKQMDKISRFYQGILNLNERIDSLVEGDKYIRARFLSILEWEKNFSQKLFQKFPGITKDLCMHP